MDLAAFPVKDTTEMMAPLLQRIAAANDQVHLHSLSRFHARSVPAISVAAYLQRILKYAPASNAVFVSVLVYLDRMASAKVPFVVCSANIHRLLISLVMVATKFFSDIFYTNSHYAKVGGLSVTELNQLELELLFMIEFNLTIAPRVLQRYADQLLVHAMAEKSLARANTGAAQNAMNLSTSSLNSPPSKSKILPTPITTPNAHTSYPSPMSPFSSNPPYPRNNSTSTSNGDDRHHTNNSCSTQSTSFPSPPSVHNNNHHQRPQLPHLMDYRYSIHPNTISGGLARSFTFPSITSSNHQNNNNNNHHYYQQLQSSSLRQSNFVPYQPIEQQLPSMSSILPDFQRRQDSLQSRPIHTFRPFHLSRDPSLLTSDHITTTCPTITTSSSSSSAADNNNESIISSTHQINHIIPFSSYGLLTSSPSSTGISTPHQSAFIQSNNNNNTHSASPLSYINEPLQSLIHPSRIRSSLLNSILSVPLSTTTSTLTSSPLLSATVNTLPLQNDNDSISNTTLVTSSLIDMRMPSSTISTTCNHNTPLPIIPSSSTTTTTTHHTSHLNNPIYPQRHVALLAAAITCSSRGNNATNTTTTSSPMLTTYRASPLGPRAHHFTSTEKHETHSPVNVVIHNNGMTESSIVYQH